MKISLHHKKLWKKIVRRVVRHTHYTHGPQNVPVSEEVSAHADLLNDLDVMINDCAPASPYCEQCGSSWAVHNDDGSCVIDEPATIVEYNVTPADSTTDNEYAGMIEHDLGHAVLRYTDHYLLQKPITRQSTALEYDEYILEDLGCVRENTPPPIRTEHKQATVIFYRAEFQAALKVALDFTQKKSMLPILECVHLVSSPGTASITVSDLSIFWTRQFTVKESADINTCVPASLLYKEIKALPKSCTEVALTFTDTNLVTVNNRAVIHTTDGAEYPETPVIVEVARATVPDLQTKITSIRPAIATDETRYSLMCAYLYFRKGKMVGTDGFRMHIEDIAPCDVDPLMIPRAAAVMLSKQPSGETFIIGDGYVSIELAGGIMITRIMHDQYPEYEHVWPHPTEKITFSRSEFMQILEGAEHLAYNKIVTLSTDIDLEIASEGDFGRYRWHIPCTITGELPESSFNMEFLRDAVNAYPMETVELSGNRTFGAFLINERALVMPIRR